jgi:hypothetical protein
MENKIIPPTAYCCGFCGRTRDQVRKLVRGFVGYAAHKEQIRERCRRGSNPDHSNQWTSVWTDERQRWLVSLYQEKLPMSEIGRRMGITKVPLPADCIDAG